MCRELKWGMIALAMCGALGACSESADARVQREAARVRRQAAVSATPTVERVTIPADSGRLIYDPAPDLAAATPGRRGVAINGVDTSTRKAAASP
ncbi:MAG: hypothetical protein ABI884_03530 [Gemmatimonadota bacterium]